MKFDVNEYLKELETIVNIDSGSRVPGGAAKVADYFEAKYKELGLSVKRTIVNEELNASMLEIRNKPETERIDVMLMGHMDTVFPDGEAVRRPFSMDETWAYGPGVCDMKAGLLFIYHLVQNLLANDTKLSFCVLMNSDEEISSVDSQQRIKEVARMADYAFVLEPGRKNGAYVNERKGLARYKLVVDGVAAHAGIAPQDGANAINEAAHITLEMESLNHYDIGTSVNVGIINGGASANVVCDHVECMVDTRFEEIEEHHKIEDAFKKFSENPRNPRTTVTFTREGFRPPMRKTAKTEALMALMNEKGAEVGVDMKWVKTGGGSDGNFIAFEGCTVVDAAGPVGDGAHSVRECMKLETIEPRINLLYNTLLDLEHQKN